MKHVILFDDNHWTGMLPLSFTRPVSEIRVGILTIKEKWEKALNASISYITQDYLSDKYPFKADDDNYIINSSIIPTPYILKCIEALESNSAIVWSDTLVAARLNREQLDALKLDEAYDQLKGHDISKEGETLIQIKRPQDIFSFNDLALKLDFDLLTAGRKSQDISADNRLTRADQIFVEEGAKISNSILNASNGPIYIGKDAEILDGSMIRGSFALLDNAKVNMGAKIYGSTTIGPSSKVGGELNNVVIQGFSNKSHDGYLGNSVIGEWCNIGADTNASNLKNNYSEVKIYHYGTGGFEATGLQFCGLIMGDHSKCGINTMFNTGSVVGVGVNLFGSGYPRVFIPSFAWGGAKGFTTYRIDKMLESVKLVMPRKNRALNSLDEDIIRHIYNFTKQYRNWE